MPLAREQEAFQLAGTEGAKRTAAEMAKLSFPSLFAVCAVVVVACGGATAVCVDAAAAVDAAAVDAAAAAVCVGSVRRRRS